MKDLILDQDGDLLIENGDFVIGESLEQEVSTILKTNKGEFKEDPIMGCDMIRLIKSKANKLEVTQIVKKQLLRDGKDYNRIKEEIISNIK